MKDTEYKLTPETIMSTCFPEDLTINKVDASNERIVDGLLYVLGNTKTMKGRYYIVEDNFVSYLDTLDGNYSVNKSTNPYGPYAKIRNEEVELSFSIFDDTNLNFYIVTDEHENETNFVLFRKSRFNGTINDIMILSLMGEFLIDNALEDVHANSPILR